MKKTYKTLLIAGGVLVALPLLTAGIIAATFNPNDYKPQLIRLTQEKTQRTLEIPGEIKLGFFPSLALELGPASLSERNSNARFASVEQARLSLALLPLLAKKAVVDEVSVAGLRANIVRDKEGHSNYEDLLSSEKNEEKGQQILFDIDSIRISDAQVTYDDRQQARKFEIANLNLESGRIADRVPGKVKLSADVKANQPAVAAHVALGTGFTLDLAQKQITLKGLDAQIKGALAGFSELTAKLSGDAALTPETRRIALDGIKLDLQGKRAQDNITASVVIPQLAVADKQVSGKLNGEAKLASGARTINASFSLPSFTGTPQAFSLPALTLDANVKDDKLDAKAKLSGAFSGNLDALSLSSPQVALALSGTRESTPLSGSVTTPLSVDLKAQRIVLSKIAADVQLPNPAGGSMALKAGGNAGMDLAKHSVTAALNGSVDQSTFNARLGMAGEPAAYTFDIGIDQLDLDRYTRKPVANAAGGAPAPAQAKAQPAQPMDLSFLQDLRAKGSMRVGTFKVANLKSSNVRLDLVAANGKLDISPLAANLYGGSTNGALSVTAAKPARFALRQTLSGVHVGPLLKDAIDKMPIEGRGNVQLDVSASGLTVDQIKKALNGSARLELHDGAVRGINIAQAVRSAKSRIGELTGREQAQTGAGSAGEKTDFSELSASFRIVNGVARNDDLDIKSPLLRIGGAGEVNLGEDRLDYLVKATVVPTLQGQGGPELQALKGLTVPVRLSGPFTAIGWRIDFAGMASELAKQRLEGKREEVKSKAQQAIDEQKSKLQEQMKEGLKGFFRK